MAESDLIPFTSGEQAKELGRKGGSRRTEKKRYAALITASAKAKCKNCKANCFLKKSNPKGLTCPIPEARAHAIFYGKAVMDKGILQRMNDNLLFQLYNTAKTDVARLKLRNTIMEQMRTEHPAVQKSISLTAEVETISLEEDFANFKKLQIEWKKKNLV